ncbi:hypothetical protein [Planctobacterium marinum]|uniref:Uncharacterized protein n=1 Tax=Planctobacterium marinum TaxID=1631968 RepID=A0AA48HRQ2_9ALTE|nr:hypothetical protein MACH26_01390 [Planctobacterium marinum]
MKEKLIGSTLILLPLVMGGLLYSQSMVSFWYLQDNFKLFDLVNQTIHLFVVMFGVWLCSKRGFTLNILLFIVFIVYQVFAWQFESKRFLVKMPLPEHEVVLFVAPYDAGALSSSLVTLEIARKKLNFFWQIEKIESFENISNASLLLLAGSEVVQLRMTSFEGVGIVKQIELIDLLNLQN